MPYDEDLALRLQVLLAAEAGLTTKRMFGGLAFLIDGHLTVAASSKGGLLVRVDPAATPQLLERPRTARMVMGGREMDGWLRVADDGDGGLDDDAALQPWIDEALAYVRTLPPKTGAR
jgi:hypothetical protein